MSSGHTLSGRQCAKRQRRPLRPSAQGGAAYAKYWRGEALEPDELAAIADPPHGIAPPNPDAALGAVAVHRPSILATVDTLAADIQAALGLHELAAWEILTDYCRRGRAVTLAEAA